MKYTISNIDPSEYTDVVEVWEASVRATHTFLKEEDIQYFKPLILNEYLKAVRLKGARDEENRIVGFLGVSEDAIEMLFLHPNVIGKGVGKLLINYAFEEFEVYKVDVNEDNPKAVEFYKHFDFEVIKRSDVDGMGKPYPILHMELNK